MAKHAKQCASTYTYTMGSGSTFVVRCEKHLRHANREHQFRMIRWAEQEPSSALPDSGPQS